MRKYFVYLVFGVVVVAGLLVGAIRSDEEPKEIPLVPNAELIGQTEKGLIYKYVDDGNIIYLYEAKLGYGVSIAVKEADARID